MLLALRCHRQKLRSSSVDVFEFDWMYIIELKKKILSRPSVRNSNSHSVYSTNFSWFSLTNEQSSSRSIQADARTFKLWREKNKGESLRALMTPPVALRDFNFILICRNSLITVHHWHVVTEKHGIACNLKLIVRSLLLARAKHSVLRWITTTLHSIFLALISIFYGIEKRKEREVRCTWTCDLFAHDKLAFYWKTWFDVERRFKFEVV